MKKINYRNSQACRDCAICPQCTGNQFRSVSRLESEAVLAFRVVPRSEIGGSTITICRARRSSSRGRQKGFRTKSARSSSKKMASTLDDERTRQRGDDLFIVGILTWTGNTGRDPVAPDVLDCRENTRLVVDQDVVARRITLLEDNPAAAEVLLTASMAAARRLQARPKLGRIRLELAPERYRLLVATRLSLSTGLRRRG